MPIGVDWPAAICGTSTTTLPPSESEEVITASTSVPETNTSTPAATTTVALGIIDAVVQSKSDELQSDAEPGASSTEMLVYTGASTGQVALIVIVIGAILVGVGAILLNPRPLRRI